jgi:hypothetical protein
MRSKPFGESLLDFWRSRPGIRGAPYLPVFREMWDIPILIQSHEDTAVVAHSSQMRLEWGTQDLVEMEILSRSQPRALAGCMDMVFNTLPPS